jgi:ribosome maturation factor RimP
VGQKPAFFVGFPIACIETGTMSNRELEARIEQLIAPDLDTVGYELVRVQLMPGGSYQTLQVMAERLDGKPMTVHDCTQISHAVSVRLGADDTLADRYTLEVSSPGLDRPLIRLKDFERFTGHVARVELETPLDGKANGKQRFQGSIVRITRPEPEAEIEFRTENGDVRVPMNAIARAKLVLTEALLNVKGGTKH